LAGGIEKSCTESIFIPADFESIIKELADWLESVEIRATDQNARTNLEERMVSLDDKLKAFEAHLTALDGVKLGVAMILEKIDDLRIRNEKRLEGIERELVESATNAAIRPDIASLKKLQIATHECAEHTLEAVDRIVGHLVNRLAAVEESLSQRVDQQVIAAPTDGVGASTAKPVFPLVADASGLAPAPIQPLEKANQSVQLSSSHDPILTPGRSLAEMADTCTRNRAVSPAIPTNFEAVINKLADRFESIRSSGENSLENLRRSIGGPTAATPVMTKREAQSLQEDTLAASRATAGSTPWTDKRTVGSNCAGAARQRPWHYGQARARSATAILMQKRISRRESAGRLRWGVVSLIVGIGFTALALGGLRLAIDFFRGPSESSQTPVSQSGGDSSRSSLAAVEARTALRGVPSDFEDSQPLPTLHDKALATTGAIVSESKEGSVAAVPPVPRDGESTPLTSTPFRSEQGSATAIPPTPRDEAPVLRGTLFESVQGSSATVPSAPRHETPTARGTVCGSVEDAMATVPPAPHNQAMATPKATLSGSTQGSLAGVSQASRTKAAAALKGTQSRRGSLAANTPVSRDVGSGVFVNTTRRAVPANPDHRAIGVGSGRHAQRGTNLAATQTIPTEPSQNQVKDPWCWLPWCWLN
jgi:hypothetical protein